MTIEQMIKAGRSLPELSGEELWQLRESTDVVAAFYTAIQNEIVRRLEGRGL